jgi:hypothetical protein
MIVAILIGVAFAIRASVTALFVKCWDDKANISSPDSRHIAHRTVHICEGPLIVNVNITQAIEISAAGAEVGMRVFENDENDGSMHWVDSNELAVEIGSVSTIIRSLHEADGIHITYHVARKLLDMKAAEESERQTEELHRTGRSTDGDYEAEKKVDRWLRQWREDFVRWASENAIIDEPKF